MIWQRCPQVAERWVALLNAAAGSNAILSTSQAAECALLLAADGFQAPSWQQIVAGQRPSQEHEREFGKFLRGWQRTALPSPRHR